jgi:putative flavoprotein involved in K+ transport
VTLAVGEHTRMVRWYRGADVYQWMDRAGVLDDPADENGNLEGARRQPSLQLVGREDRSDLDLRVLSRQGVRLVGRLARIDGNRVGFHGDLELTTRRSHLRMMRVLQRVDGFIEDRGLAAPPPDEERLRPFIRSEQASIMDLRRAGIATVIWATGYRRRYNWLKVPVVDADGELVQSRGLTAAPGLYAVGLTFLRRRRSAFIDGCGIDAAEIAETVKTYLDRPRERAA